MELALKAMNGLSGQRGDRRSEWYIEIGCETAVGISDEVVLQIHDAGGKNGDIRTSLALPINDALDMIEELSKRALQVAREHRADALSRLGRSPCRSEEHTSELQSLMRSSYAVFCLKKKKKTTG